MKLSVGTSGYAFKEWKGDFYPEDLPDAKMLSHYASQFSTVEINNTFYRLPKTHVLTEWASQVNDEFRFAIKASQRITHFARLKPEAAGPLEFLLTNTAEMGEKLGVILFQLPPNLKKDLDRLRAFADLLPRDRRFTFEFRHASWFEDDVVAELRSRAIPMCVSDQDEYQTPMIATADWGYVRLHRVDYDDQSLSGWLRRLAGEPWKDVFVYFTHDEGAGSGPPAARRLLALSAQS